MLREIPNMDCSYVKPKGSMAVSAIMVRGRGPLLGKERELLEVKLFAVFSE